MDLLRKYSRTATTTYYKVEWEKKKDMAIKLKIPITVMIVCLFELLGLILLPSALFKETTKQIGLWYQIYIAVTGVFSASIIWYLWKMKKAGVYIYFIMYAVHNIVALLVGNWLIYVFLIPIVGGMLLLPHFKKMS